MQSGTNVQLRQTLDIAAAFVVYFGFNQRRGCSMPWVMVAFVCPLIMYDCMPNTSVYSKAITLVSL